MRTLQLSSSALLLAIVAVPSLAAAVPNSPVHGLAELADAATLARPGALNHMGQKGERVTLGTEVQSGSTSVHIRLANGGVVELMPNSRIAMVGSTDVVLGRDGGSTATRFDLKHGEAIVTMPTKADKVVTMVASGDALCAIRAGSRAVVHTTGEGRTPPLAVALYSGDARVATQGAWRTLEPGQTIRFATGEHLTSPNPLTSAPAWQKHFEESSLAVVIGDSTIPMNARFIASPGATGYVLTVTKSTGEVVESSELGASATDIITVPLGAGMYAARLATRGPDGFAGAPGAARTFRIARVSLPPGGTVVNGTLSIPPDRAASLDDASGLDIAVDRGGFVHADSALPTMHDEPILMFLRLRDERAAVRVALAPRATRATVELSPKRAVWPLDPIDIVVRIQNGKDDEKLEPKLKVRVNMKTLPVVWHRDGNVFRARVEPDNTRGPSIVHVDVDDAYGSELGRGFLEIEGPQTAIARAATASR